MTMKGETVLTGGEHPGTMPEVMHSGAGWYVGFRDKDGMPYSRETVYFHERAAAEMVLGLIRLPESYPVYVPDHAPDEFPT